MGYQRRVHGDQTPPPPPHQRVSVSPLLQIEKMASKAPSAMCCDPAADCCGQATCCTVAKDGKLVDSGLSQVQLDVVALNNNAERKMTRHEARFGITSFIYRSRRPFHPGSLGDVLLEPFFSKMQIEDE